MADGLNSYGIGYDPNAAGFDSDYAAYTLPIDITALRAQASNISNITNPAYAITDFLSFYPQFSGKVLNPVLTTFISIANSKLDSSRYNEQWTFVMALMVAHYTSLYLQATISMCTSPSQGAKPTGVATSKSVGDVSVSYQNIVDEDWGDLNLTMFGQQLITFAKLAGKGQMFIP